MSKKDYLAIGGVLSGAWRMARPQEKGIVWSITLLIADRFAQDNKRFDRKMFYSYVLDTPDAFEARDQCNFPDKDY